MTATSNSPVKYFVGRMVIGGKKVVRVMRRRIVVGRFKMKKVIYEMASKTWVKPPAKFIQASNLFNRREEARAEKRRWEGKVTA